MYNGILTGLGGRGLFWIDQAKQQNDAQLVAFVEPVEANRVRAIQSGIPSDHIFPSLDEAMAKVKADFVLDVTPPAVHHQIAKKAFTRGLHVLQEKPLSDNYGSAKDVVSAGKKAGVKHMITQNYRFGACPRATRKLLAEGVIGKPGQLDIRFYMNWADVPNSHYVTQPYMLINDMMVHHFDMMRYVLGADPVAVQAITWNHPWGWHKGDAAHAIVFEFPDNLWATHVSVGCAVGQMTGWDGDWRIEGPKGTITWDNGHIFRAHLYRTDKPIREELPAPEVPPGPLAILAEFTAAIRENRQPECNAADNLKSVAMVFAAIESAKGKRRVSLAEL